jgi:hypothetical protein
MPALRWLPTVALTMLFAASASAQDLFPESEKPPLPLSQHDGGESLLDNFSIFSGIEASRQPQDLGINANFGGNFSANLGVPLVKEWGLGAQIGMGVNLSKAGVKVLRVVEGTQDRQQWFTTVGLFKRSDGWYAGVGYDFQVSRYYDRIHAGQVRAETGVAVGEQNEVGLWGTLAAGGDRVRVLGSDFRIRPISQVNLFWNHKWETGAETRLWIGVAGQHGTDIVLLPDTHRSDPAIAFGLQVFVPLNDRFALFGQGNFVTPSDTGTLDAYLGFAYFFGGSRQHRTNRYAPVLPVANNPTFALDLRRP